MKQNSKPMALMSLDDADLDHVTGGAGYGDVFTAVPGFQSWYQGKMDSLSNMFSGWGGSSNAAPDNSQGFGSNGDGLGGGSSGGGDWGGGGGGSSDFGGSNGWGGGSSWDGMD